MSATIVFNKEEFTSFLNSFDPIHKKFFFMIDKDDYEKFIEQNHVEYYKCIDDIYNCLASENVFNKWNVDVQCQVYDVVNTVYFDNDNYNSNDYSEKILGNEEIVGVTLQKFVYDYLNIAGVSELFNPEFFKFEKMMHEEYRNNQKPYYRDHYIHQVRNMYEMFSFLDDIKLIDKCIEHQFNRDKEIGEFLNIAISRELQNLNADERRMFGKAYNLIVKSENNKKYKNINDYKVDFFKHYIIYGTSIVSSLLHDIGYPLDFLSRIEEMYENFIPTSKVFIDVKDDFVYIHNVLKDSLLFQIVNNDEIKEKVLNHNHGTMSAIIILMYYYQTSAANRLSPVENAIIELSAFVIYNHTVNYSFQTLKEERLYKNIFVKGPLSYLFRLCDDLQEWDRTYYEITDKGNIFICPKCKRSMLSSKHQHLNDTHIRKYLCACPQENKNLSVAGMRLGNFNYRRIMNAIACNEVIITYDNGIMNINIDYGLDNLLQLSFYNVNYAHYRQSELESLRRSLMLEADFPYGYVNGLATYNPIYIKCEILKTIGSLNIANEFSNELSDILSKSSIEIKNYIDKIYRKFNVYFENANPSQQILELLFPNETIVKSDLLEKNLNFYIFLMNLGNYFEETALQYNITDKNITKLIDDIIEKSLNVFSIKTLQIVELLRDYLYHKINHVSYSTYVDYLDNVNNQKKIKMRCLYEKMGKSLNSEILKNKIRAYTDFRVKSNAYYKLIHNNDDNNSGPTLDFFSDFYIFYLLAQKKGVKYKKIVLKSNIQKDFKETVSQEKTTVAE